jgi:hypothetical protein
MAPSEATSYGIRRLQGPIESHHGRTALRNRQTRSGVPKASCTQSEQARTKAETKARRFPRPCRLAGCRFQLLPASNQCIVSESLADDSRKQQLEAVEIGSVLTVVKPERLFVNVAEQVVRLDRNVGSIDTALEQAPEIFQTVSVDILPNVLDSVIHNLMGVFFTQAVIGLQRVGVQRGLWFNVIADQGLKLGLAATVDNLCPNLSAALQNSRNDCLTFGSTPSLNLPRLFRRVHVPCFAADKGFVNFDAVTATAQLAASLFVLHRKANTVEHEPSGLLSYADGLGNLIAADSIFAVGNHPGSGKPFIQGDRGILKNRFGFDGKLLAAFGALPDAASLEEHRFLGSAVLAYDAHRPAAVRDFAQRVIRVGVVSDGLHQGGGFDVFHASSMPEKRGCVNDIFTQIIRLEL